MSMSETFDNQPDEFDLSDADIAALNANMNGEDFDTDSVPQPSPTPGEGGSLDGEVLPPENDGTGGQQRTAPAPQNTNQDDDENHPDLEPVTDGRGQPVTDAKGRPQKRVNFHKYQRLEQAYNDLQRQHAELQTNNAAEMARIQERLAIINEALATPQQPAQQPQQQQQEEEPDPEKDIFGYAKWAGSRMKAMADRIDQLENSGRMQEAQRTLETTYRQQASEYAGKEPNFAPAYVYLISQRQGELALRYPRNADGSISQEDAAKVRAQIAREEQGLVKKAMEMGINAGQYIFELAKTRGYQVKTAEELAALRNGGQRQQQPPAGQQQQRQPPAQRQQPQDPGALDAGGRTAPAQRQQQPGQQRQQPTASDVIASIKNGQQAAMSLSNAGGDAPPALTPHLLVGMSDDEFADLIDRLPESKLRELMGD